MPLPVEVSVSDHADAVTPESRFGPVVYRGQPWDLSHLEPFLLHVNIAKAPDVLEVVVVVLFSCHCFTHSDRVPGTMAGDYYRDGREVRTLCPERYALSRQFLPHLVRELGGRHIQTASATPNFVTIEALGADGQPGHYAMFFTVTKDARRGKRLLLRVQSAYRMDAISGQLRKAGKVNFSVLLRATYEGRKIKG